MSVYLTCYVVYGVELNAEDCNRIDELTETEEYEKAYDSFYDDFPVKDNMSGQYAVLGEVLYSFTPWEDCEDLKEIDLSNLDKLKETTLKRAEKYPGLKELFDNREFKLYTVNIYR